ncbi:hypothetical protein J0S82_016479, partial [Galemys pyrenaicus]
MCWGTSVILHLKRTRLSTQQRRELKKRNEKKNSVMMRQRKSKNRKIKMMRKSLKLKMWTQNEEDTIQFSVKFRTLIFIPYQATSELRTGKRTALNSVSIRNSSWTAVSRILKTFAKTVLRSTLNSSLRWWKTRRTIKISMKILQDLKFGLHEDSIDEMTLLPKYVSHMKEILKLSCYITGDNKEQAAFLEEGLGLPLQGKKMKENEAKFENFCKILKEIMDKKVEKRTYSIGCVSILLHCSQDLLNHIYCVIKLGLDIDENEVATEELRASVLYESPPHLQGSEDAFHMG